MMRIILFSVLFFVSFVSFSQVVKGYVYDRNTGKPLDGASVYFDGTTIGTITNEKGYFVLEIKRKSTAPLVVSFIGYEKRILSVQNDTQEYKIYLSRSSVILNEVVLKADPFSRAQKLRAFKEQFLGKTKAGISCKILNEDAIYLSFDLENNQLTAQADEPVIIKNPYLGYELRFQIEECIISYYAKSLKTNDIKQTFFAGTSFFIDLDEKNKQYWKRREKTFKGSVLHLMRTTISKNWDNEDFEIYERGFPTLPERSFTISDTLNLKMIKLNTKLDILYKDRRSTIFPKYKGFFVDGFGNYYPADALRVSGEMGNKRIGDLLPLDYGL